MRGAELIMAELASILAKAWPELLLGVIILYACIALLLIVLVFIGGRLQARIKTAIERLTAMIAELAERSADMTQSKSADADSTEIINAIERLSIKIDHLTEHPVAAAQPEGHALIGAEASAAIERLTVGCAPSRNIEKRKPSLYLRRNQSRHWRANEYSRAPNRKRSADAKPDP